MGKLLMAIGLVAGLALSAFLYQWDSAQRALEASPTPPAAASSALASDAGAGPTAGASAAKQGGGDTQGGKTLFNSLCNACHPNGKAGVGPAVTGLSEEAVRATTRKGKGSMPGFSETQVSEGQLAELVAYIKSLK